MKAFRMVMRTISEAFKNIFRQGWLSFSAVLSMMVTLLLTSVLVIVSLNIQNATTLVAQGLETVVYLKHDVSDKDVDKMLREIEKIDNVKAVEFKTAQSAFDDIIAKDQQTEILGYLRDRSTEYLNDEITVTMIDADGYESLNTTLTTKYGDKIDKLSFSKDIADSILPVFEGIRKAAFYLIIAVAFVAVILISNTIRITIVARRREIEIMRLVAASNWYIRTPFIIEGILLGIIGALIATAISVGAYWYYLPALTTQIFLGATEVFVPVDVVLKEALIWTLGIGAIIGFIGSIFPVRKYLKK